MRNRCLRTIAGALLVAGLAGGCHSKTAPAERPDAARFDPALVARGASLAAIGGCHGCHTPRGGESFGGGEPMHSPFGVIHSTNISPDPDYGIGRWTLEAFERAMREGVRADGRHLYPAFPYERFTAVSHEDNEALYAYLMSQPAVRRAPPANEIMFPFNIRAGISLWKLLFFKEAPAALRSPPTDTEMARGQYLVEGLGHCGSCHSPRNLFQAEKKDKPYEGGDLEGWHAYAINARFAGPVPWEVESLAFYLRTGFHPHHGAARGTMGLVTSELAHADPGDVKAMAAYVVLALMQRPDEARRRAGDALVKDPFRGRAITPTEEGAQIYVSTCSKCHDGSREMPFGGVPLPLSLGIHGESPRNLINVVVHGLNPAHGETSPMMPGFGEALSDAQLETLVHWLRANFTGKPRWQEVGRLIRESRRMRPSMLLFPPGGAGAPP